MKGFNSMLPSPKNITASALQHTNHHKLETYAALMPQGRFVNGSCGAVEYDRANALLLLSSGEVCPISCRTRKFYRFKIRELANTEYAVSLKDQHADTYLTMDEIGGMLHPGYTMQGDDLFRAVAAYNARIARDCLYAEDRLILAYWEF